MARFKDFTASGVIPATLLAFNNDHTINWTETTRHLTHVAATPGLSAITVNGHASEVHACSFDEQREILDHSLDDVGDRLPVIAGVFADASDLPLICFNYARWTNLAYPLDTIISLAEKIPSLCAVKDWTAEPMEHERNIRTLQSLSRPINVLSTNSAWLMASLSMGASGLLSGAGSIIPDLQVAMFQAIQREDLNMARAINDRMQPITQAFYASPFLDMHNRMKEAAVLLDRQDRAVVRPPLMKITQPEIDRIDSALKAARISHDGADDLNLETSGSLAAE
jgi:4-hydroxy-tetrahydrodipicolinate synthase